MGLKRSDWIIIGISGVTCGGKTSLANKLQKTVAPVQVIHQDDYFYPDNSPHHRKCEKLQHNNYDILEAVDMRRMVMDVVAVVRGARTVPPADTGALAPGRLCVAGKSILILEGFTVLNYKPLSDLCDLRYYLTLEYSECLARRVYRLFDPPDIDGYFDQCVWPEHLKYRAELDSDFRVIRLDGTRPDSYDTVVSDLKQLGATEIIQ